MTKSIQNIPIGAGLIKKKFLVIMNFCKFITNGLRGGFSSEVFTCNIHAVHVQYVLVFLFLTLTLSTSLVKGLVEFQLHHFLWSWGRGGRKSWKVRTLQARGRELPDEPADPAGDAVGSAEGPGDGQSLTWEGPVSLCRRNLSRCRGNKREHGHC